MIIGDEPVSALDVSIQAQIINLLLDLQAQFHLSYIIISHDLSIVEHLCDRILVMYLGKLVEIASYHDLYSNPNTRIRRRYSRPSIYEPKNEKNRMILTGNTSPIHPPPGLRFHLVVRAAGSVQSGRTAASRAWTGAYCCMSFV